LIKKDYFCPINQKKWEKEIREVLKAKEISSLTVTLVLRKSPDFRFKSAISLHKKLTLVY